ncbi:MAG: hemolysin family protein [Acidimicrobiales bacterium]
MSAVGSATPLVLAVQLSTTDVWLLVAVAVLMFIASASALAETAVVRISKAKATAMAEDGTARTRALLHLVEAPERWLNALLFVTLVSQIVQATLTGVVSGRLFGGVGVAVATFVNVVITFVFAEAAPKTWALQHTDRAALLSARPVKVLVDFAPLRLLSQGLIGLTNVILPGKGLKQGPFVSEEELLAVAFEAAEADVIQHDERRLIESILEFGDTVVREVMVPRPDMVTVNHDFRVADVMEVVLLNGYSRIPVLGAGGIDDIVGLVFAKDLMRAERDGREDESVSEFARSARHAPETKPASELLREMQAEQFHMAIVIDEHGGTAGLVTLEDLIEELVGEIVDEFDIEDARVEPVAGGGVRVSGSLTVDDANDLLDVHLPEGDYDTVSGLMLHQLGRLANAGDIATCGSAQLTVERVQGRRIMRVRIDKVAAGDQAATVALATDVTVEARADADQPGPVST